VTYFTLPFLKRKDEHRDSQRPSKTFLWRRYRTSFSGTATGHGSREAMRESSKQRRKPRIGDHQIPRKFCYERALYRTVAHDRRGRRTEGQKGFRPLAFSVRDTLESSSGCTLSSLISQIQPISIRNHRNHRTQAHGHGYGYTFIMHLITWVMLKNRDSNIKYVVLQQ
jgi:hypothetical protein